MANNATEQSTSSASDRKTWSAKSFYGTSKFTETRQLDSALNVNSQCGLLKTEIPSKYTSILGLSRTWRVFRKQHDALEFAKLRRSELMTFVYEETNGTRIFIVAHPIFYWYNSLQKSPEDRCSYEIIPDKAICKLYFDLEFVREFNPGKDGVRMTNTFIFVIGYFLKKFFQIYTNRSNILDLDSSTDVKFSRHLIYQLSNVVFRDNLQIRDFVKSVVARIREWIKKTDGGVYPENTESFIKCNLKVRDLHELVVTDGKGNLGLFCDESVYTKNRHFRLMGCTKRNKNAHLVLSPENEYSCVSKYDSPDMFLDSLLTYFPPEYLDFKMISFENTTISVTKEHEHDRKEGPPENCKTGRLWHSPHPEIDKFILSLVTPGRIYRCYFVSSSNRIIYEIVGNRYCRNIQREHRSNNVKFVVNINSATYFQMCFDSDCAGYRSNEIKLPQEIALIFNNVEPERETVNDAEFVDFGVADTELNKILNAVEMAHLTSKQDVNSLGNINMPSSSKTYSNLSSEITDQEMIEVMDQFEQHQNYTNALSSDHHSQVSTVHHPKNHPAVPNEPCNSTDSWEKDQVNMLLENSDFFEPCANFLNYADKNVANLDKDKCVNYLSEVQHNRVMSPVKRCSKTLIDNENLEKNVKEISPFKSQNADVFPDFGMLDSELLSVVYPKT